MKKLKPLIPLLTFLVTLLPVDSKAQQFELVQGFNLNFFNIGGTKYEYTIFETTPALGYNIGLDFWLHPNNLSPIMLSAHIFHQKGSVFYFHDEFENYESSVHFNTRYLVFGLQPYTYISKNKRLEVAAAIEIAFLFQDRSEGYDNQASLFPPFSSFYSDRNTSDPNKDIGIFGKLSFGYVFDVGNSCQFIPRLTMRLADLKDQTVVGDERSIGLEFGFRF